MSEASAQTLEERLDRPVCCPWCDSEDTRISSPFGGTVSEILFVCNRCHQSFGFMKWDERFDGEPS